MFCQKCGNELKENSVFCDQCGNKVETTDNINNDEVHVDVPEFKTTIPNTNDCPNEVKRKSKGKSIFIGACVALVVILIVLAFAFGDDSTANDDDYISAAKAVVVKQYNVPMTAVYSNEKIVTQDEYGRTIVYFTAEFQNIFDGNVAKDCYILIESYDTNDDTFRYDKYNGVYIVNSGLGFSESLMDDIIKYSDWGKPFQTEELEE